MSFVDYNVIAFAELSDQLQEIYLDTRMTISGKRRVDFKPSEMMRLRRPELYSDSESIGAYRLSKPVLSHHIMSLTERNEHKPFEDFCRALAQREICRNLRPQTGPEGGGDGKVDTETYPVSPTVSDNWYEGTANKDGDQWAFAFSAKKTWTTKVRSDVKGIVETGRPYKHIHFFTSQNPRAKKRLEVQEALTEKYGVPVTIYDRNWIEEKVVDHDHADLAYDILDVGEFDPASVRKGATDTYRENELSDIEGKFTQPDKSDLTDLDSVSEALRAAKLSRGLERPRYETDGRFDRAIRLAEQHGSRRQQFVAIYEKAWTAIWWFDDLVTPNILYDELEERALQDGECFELERLGNLLKIFVGRERHDAVPSDTYQIIKRFERLSATLTHHSKNLQRPNHALYAETLLVLHELTEHMLAERLEKFEEVWNKLSDIVDRARGLAEYPAELVSKMTDVFTQFFPDSDDLDNLINKVAEFMGERRKEGVQGELLLRRGAQKIDNEKPLEAIAWLGKAALAFNKKEYNEKQVETLYNLAIAYRGAGLFWAARASALSCLVVLSSIANEEGEIQKQSIPATKLYGLLCLQMGHIPDVLQALYLLKLYQSHISLSEEGAERLMLELVEQDQYLACAFMALEKSYLHELDALPDFLDHIQFYMARSVLLYRLGYQKIIRDDGSIPTVVTDQELIEFMALIAAQPVTKSFPSRPVLNEEKSFVPVTKILGVHVSFDAEVTNKNIAICELLIATLEGFTATMLNRGVLPYTPSAIVRLIEHKGDEIEIEVEQDTVSTIVKWPVRLSPSDPTRIKDVQRGLLNFVVQVVGLTTTSRDPAILLEELFRDEMVFDRSIVFSNTAVSHGRVFNKEVSRLSDLPIPSPTPYPIKKSAPDIVPAEIHELGKVEKGSSPELKRHSDLSVHTIINPYLWDRAEWGGTAYFSFGSDYPPVLGLLFHNIEAGKKIFDDLITRLGKIDENELIRIAVLKGIDKVNPLHYVVHVAAKRDAYTDLTQKSKSIVSISRHNLMEAISHKNLSFFQREYARFGAYFLAPAEMTYSDPSPIMEHRILKRDFHVNDAWRIGRQHEDAPAVLDPKNVLVPEGVTNPPIRDLAAYLNSRSND